MTSRKTKKRQTSRQKEESWVEVGVDSLTENTYHARNTEPSPFIMYSFGGGVRHLWKEVSVGEQSGTINIQEEGATVASY